MSDTTITSVTGISTTAQQDDTDIIKENFRNIEFIPFCMIIVIGFLGNLAVLFNGTKKRMLSKHYSNYFILSIAVADLGVVMMAIPINIVEYTSGLDVGQFTCAFILPIRETFQCAAMQSVAMLGLARLRHITKAPHVPITKRRCFIIIMAIWLNSYLVTSLPMAFIYKISPDGVCDPEWPNEILKKIYLTFACAVLYLPVILVTISYLSILRKIKNLWKPGNDSEGMTRKNRNLSILLILLITNGWISAMPLVLYMMLLTYEIVEIPMVWWSVIGILYYSSSAINPILVLIMNRDYRFKLPRCSVQRKCRVGNMRSQQEMSIRNHNVGNCPHACEIAAENNEEKKEEEPDAKFDFSSNNSELQESVDMLCEAYYFLPTATTATKASSAGR